MHHTAGSKKKEKQTTVLVEGRKDKSQPFGLILSKKVQHSDKTLGVHTYMLNDDNDYCLSV